MNIAETVQDMGIKPGELSLKYAHFGAEAWTDEMRAKIETLLGVKAYNPAFDVTPHELISGVITEKRLVRAPYAEALARL
jgi:methylthioribose-1-phosphate isomerase